MSLHIAAVLLLQASSVGLASRVTTKELLGALTADSHEDLSTELTSKSHEKSFQEAAMQPSLVPCERTAEEAERLGVTQCPIGKTGVAVSRCPHSEDLDDDYAAVIREEQSRADASIKAAEAAVMAARAQAQDQLSKALLKAKTEDLSAEEAKEIFLQLVEGLEKCHAAGFAPCYSPGKLSLNITQNTDKFQAPEVITATREWTGLPYERYAADVFTVGVTLYTLLTKEDVWGDTPRTCQCLKTLPRKHPVAISCYGMHPPPLLREDIAMNYLLRDLITGMLMTNHWVHGLIEQRRLTLDQIKKHPWVTGENTELPDGHSCCCRRADTEGDCMKLIGKRAFHANTTLPFGNFKDASLCCKAEKMSFKAGLFSKFYATACNPADSDHYVYSLPLGCKANDLK